MTEDEEDKWPKTGIYATFRVESVDETMEWYKRTLGWKVGKDAFDKEGNCTFGSVIYGRGQAINFTCDKNPPESYHMELMIDVPNVDALYERILKEGGKPLNRLKNETWGGRTFTIKDINGLTLTFVQLP
jgi:predicted enzyme related to lactoylglutathione lyase